MKHCLVVDLGLIEYRAALDLQRRIVAARKAGAVPDVLVLCEHPHVITLGRNGKRANLLASDHVLSQMGVSFFETNRGGDITYHGPGQLVGYPILNLSKIRRDVGWYVRSLEETMIRATAELGIASKRVRGRTGVWVDVAMELPKEIEHFKEAKEVGEAHKVKENEEDKEVKDQEKLAAIGVHLSRWVTSHGFAYNVSTDLRYFDLIVPCGIAGKRATSLEKLLGRNVEVKTVAPRIARHVGEIFGLDLRESNAGELDGLLRNSEDRTVLAGA